MRRTRCHKHKDMLTEGRCPRCQLEKAREENREILKVLSMYGDPVGVKVGGQCRYILGKILELLALPRSLGDYKPGQKSLKIVGVGIDVPAMSGHRDWHCILPRKIAEAASELADEIEVEYSRVYRRAFDEGIRRVETGVERIMGRLARLEIGEAIVEAEEARALATAYSRDNAFTKMLNEAIKKAGEIDDLLGEIDEP